MQVLRMNIFKGALCSFGGDIQFIQYKYLEYINTNLEILIPT